MHFPVKTVSRCKTRCREQNGTKIVRFASRFVREKLFTKVPGIFYSGRLVLFRFSLVSPPVWGRLLAGWLAGGFACVFVLVDFSDSAVVCIHNTGNTRLRDSFFFRSSLSSVVPWYVRRRWPPCTEKAQYGRLVTVRCEKCD